MGGDIAAWCALRGLTVTISDTRAEALGAMSKRAYALFEKKLRDPRLVQHAMDRLTTDLYGIGVTKADLIIEAIVENADIKKKVFQQIEANAKPDAILASNTSSIPLETIAGALLNPARLIGVHFFNPVAKMQLVEIVKSSQSDENIVKRALGFTKAIGKLPVPVKSSPGFLVNRILMPYLMEAVHLLEEGVPAKTIDDAALDFGMPMGPIELADVKKLRDPRLVQHAMDRLTTDLHGIGVTKADLIIEAIVENAEIKQKVFQQIEANAKPDAILASNTSSIPLETIANALKNPSRLIGVHFFNPVAKMQLIEIVKSSQSDEIAVKRALGFTKSIGKLPVPVKSSPGFLVNRILMPYLMEAVHLLEEGVPAKTIDDAALDFGMPMGPIELADVVGLDICLNVGETLTSHLGGEVPQLLRQKVDKGELGRKSGSGFYTWKD
eukprot:maker-scaffold944_size128685-snap-gene-0.2 protein:Tk09754 transcript:maker-scaffold944_size128685-snap-gene-0.2-mRNA-1 annotation:"crotonase"